MTATDALTSLLCENISALINANASQIEERLRSAETGKLTIPISCKLSLVKGRAYLDASLSMTSKTTDEVEASVELDDPKQAKLI